LRLESLQAGSSAMPGKINPVIPMMICQLSFIIRGKDLSIATAASAGQLEINSYGPLIGAKLLESLHFLNEGIEYFSNKCVALLTVDADRCRANLENSGALATILAAQHGYEKITAMIMQAERERRSFAVLAEEAGLIERGEAWSMLTNSATPSVGE
jgi:aspartate ammonia-lyase